jgi:hypothetical protein
MLNEVVRVLSEVLRALGRIEGELIEIRKLNERVSKLEHFQAWLKGGWTVLAALYDYLCRYLKL